jgi:hypothetical protein
MDDKSSVVRRAGSSQEDPEQNPQKNMSSEKYLGAVEFLNAIADIRQKIEMAPSFEEAVPCKADASYTDGKSVAITATVTVEAYTSKYRPSPAYRVQLEAKLIGYSIRSAFKKGNKEEIMEWLDQCRNYNEIAESLFSIYRGAWESWDSVRYRDY